MKKLWVAFLLAVCALAQKPAKPLKDGLYALFKTEFGDIRVKLYEKDVPNTVAVFAGLAQGTVAWRDPQGNMVKRPMYDNTTFFRVLPGLVAQAGSPTGDSGYNCGFTIKDEILPGFRFGGGTLAMANGGVPDTGGCQFFFTAGPAANFDNKYAIIGETVEGENVVQKLAKVPAHGETPVNPPKLLSVTIERIGPPPVVKKKK